VVCVTVREVAFMDTRFEYERSFLLSFMSEQHYEYVGMRTALSLPSSPRRAQKSAYVVLLHCLFALLTNLRVLGIGA
jgi:hypothetical protein